VGIIIVIYHMSKPHANKPFPHSLLEWSKLKVRHILCFWCLCNEFESDEEGWITISRKEFNTKINNCIPIPTHNPTLILETLQELGYVYLERFHNNKLNRCSTTDYRIKVAPDSWEPREVVNITYLRGNENSESRRAFYKARYAKQKAEKLAAKLAAEI
jgi:hypothetical protein